tara:strand:- start:4387 stop:5859 length:1473 start_codon:yes stop_codon:yes gene_type:complete
MTFNIGDQKSLDIQNNAENLESLTVGLSGEGDNLLDLHVNSLTVANEAIIDNQTIEGPLKVTGKIECDKNITSEQSVLGKNLIATTKIESSDKLVVNGDSTLNDLLVTGRANIKGRLSVQDNFTVRGTTTLGEVVLSGPIYIDDTSSLRVAGSVDIDDHLSVPILTVSGETSLDRLSTTGTTTLVDASATELTVSGETSLQSLTATEIDASGDITTDTNLAASQVRYNGTSGILNSQLGSKSLCAQFMALVSEPIEGTPSNDVYLYGSEARARAVGRYTCFTTNIGTPAKDSMQWGGEVAQKNSWAIFNMQTNEGIGSMCTICYMNPCPINNDSIPGVGATLNPIVRVLFNSNDNIVPTPNTAWDNVIAQVRSTTSSAGVEVAESGYALFPGGRNYAPTGASVMPINVVPPTGCVEFWPGDCRTFILMAVDSTTASEFVGIGEAWPYTNLPNTGLMYTNFVNTWVEVTDNYATWGNRRNSAGNYPIYDPA